MVVLSTGRNEIATAAVKLGAPSGITFTYSDTEVVGEGMLKHLYLNNA